MRKIHQNISLLAISVMTLGLVAAAPVSALASVSTSTDDAVTTEDSMSSTTTSTSTSTNTNLKHSDSVHSTAPENGVKPVAVKSDTETSESLDVSAAGLHARAQQLLASDRKDRQAKSLEVRQKACEAHKAELTTRQQNYAKSGQKHLDVFNGIYDKVVAYQTKNQLSVNNYDSLKAAADAQKAAAQAAVDAISSQSVTIDCTSSDPAAGVATLKTAVSTARQALQDYRTAIKNLVVALETAKVSANSSTSASGSASTGGNQ